MYTELPVLVNISTPTLYDTNGSAIILVNMGPIRDDTVPAHLLKLWKQQKPIIYKVPVGLEDFSNSSSSSRVEPMRSSLQQFGRVQLKLDETAVWTWATPKYKETTTNSLEKQQQQQQEIPKVLVLKGGCACGSCQYEINCEAPLELQHCYCRLCRRLSGSAFMTWISVYLTDFHWTSMISSTSTMTTSRNIDDGSNILKRYTDHGQRHVCSQCHGAVTIVYDEDCDEVIWIAAGSLFTNHLPGTCQEVSQYLDRVAHICCNSKQSWYMLPNDGMERISDAS
jgi:hypothetical protein